MTDRTRQTAGLVAQFGLAVSIAGLTLTLGVGIWKLSAMFTTVQVEHQQIFQIIKEKCK